MLRELFEGVSAQAATANGTKSRVLMVDLNRRQKRLFFPDPDDSAKVSIEDFSNDPPPMRVTLGSVTEVARWCNWVHAEAGWQPSVWIGRTGVCVVGDERDRFGRDDALALCPFEHTPEWLCLKSLRGRVFTQAELIRLLRVELAGAETESSAELLRAVRSLVRRNISQSNQQHGRSSLGSDLVAESNHAELPEHIEFLARVLIDPALHGLFTIKIAVSLDPATMQFSLDPMVAQMREAEQAVAEQIQSSLEADLEEMDVKVFLGEPVNVS